jgi:predicted O-linked N-acetylglucosamine transferase (SPINDLY family)
VPAGEVCASPAISTGQTARLGFERLDLLCSTGDALLRQARLIDADALFRTVIEKAPGDPRGYLGLASARDRIGDMDTAIELLDRVAAMVPNNANVLCQLIFSHDRRINSTLEDSYRLRRRFNDLVKVPQTRPHTNNRATDRTLRIGYVSGDFRHHSAITVMGAHILKHDRALFDVYAYSNAAAGDGLTDQIRASVTHWHDISIWTDDRLEQQIREDQIDILVDLSGHSAGNRLAVFARKPAPIQVTAWGYITGTGLDAMDYLFADADTIRPDEEQWYAEQVYRLPRIVSYWPVDASVVGPVSPPPCERNGYLTYGVMNRLGKIKRDAIRVWSRILQHVPDAVLIVKAAGLDDEASRSWLQNVFAEEGADLARLEFRGVTSHADHLKLYHEIDVCLDPWPDGGGVSTLEALWMGAPMVTLPWRQIASRLTTSFLNEVGLPYLIASSPDEYVERAVALNGQRVELAGVRSMLRDVLSASILCDHESYARHVEDAYRSIWRRWCGQQNGVTQQPQAPHMTLVAS